MGLFSTYSENVRVTYRSTTFSRATFFNFVILTMAVICPYLIAYRTQGFWTKFNHVREQPIVQFKHEVLMIMDLEMDKDSARSTMVWSTFRTLNEMLGTKVTPFITSREGDHNMDGVFEYLDLQILIPMEKQMRIHGFHIFLLFDYKLLRHATAQLEGLAYTNYNSARNGNRFNIFANLGFNYNSPLWSHIRDERYNKPVIPRDASSIRDYSIRQILQSYSSRNLTTILKNKYEFMEVDNEMSNNEFLFNIRINYVETSYECWAGLWNTLKWAWVQYFAIFIIVFSILKGFQRLAYQAKLFETLTLVPWEKRKESKTIISHQQHS